MKSKLALGFWCISALIGGCSLPQAPSSQPEPYDLGPLSMRAAPQEYSLNATPLVWGGISAVRSIDGRFIIYRLLYVHEGIQPRPYSQARWIDPPANLLGQRLRAALANTRPVIDTDAGLTSVQLRLELEDFSQSFTAPDKSYGVIQLRATLLQAQNQKGEPQVLQHMFVAQKQAATNDAAGGAQALKAASEEIIAQVLQWVNTRH